LGENVQQRVLNGLPTTVVTGVSKALAGSYRGKDGLSLAREQCALCPVCAGLGFVVGLLEYPSMETGSCCPDCEAGWRLVERIAEIVSRNQAEDRPVRKHLGTVTSLHG
jgi:hypothetical protein